MSEAEVRFVVTDCIVIGICRVTDCVLAAEESVSKGEKNVAHQMFAATSTKVTPMQQKAISRDVIPDYSSGN